jgi:hypothetical protein
MDVMWSGGTGFCPSTHSLCSCAPATYLLCSRGVLPIPFVLQPGIAAPRGAAPSRSPLGGPVRLPAVVAPSLAAAPAPGPRFLSLLPRIGTVVLPRVPAPPPP